MDTSKLTTLGLQENEARVYLALLGLGESAVTEISSRAQLNRTTAYDILERLSLYGLVSRSAGKKKKYVAEPPHRLRQYLLNKKRTAERRLKELEQSLPDLNTLYSNELKPSIHIGTGKQEMINLYDHALDAKEPIYSILNLKGYAELFDEIGKRQSAERSRQGIQERVLAIKSEVARAWHKETYGGSKKKQRDTEYRWIDADETKYPVGEVNIFDDKVIVMLSKPEENVAFEIVSQSFADFLKIVFEMAWKGIDGKVGKK